MAELTLDEALLFARLRGDREACQALAARGASLERILPHCADRFARGFALRGEIKRRIALRKAALSERQEIFGGLDGPTGVAEDGERRSGPRL